MIIKDTREAPVHSFPVFADPYKIRTRMTDEKIDDYLNGRNYNDELKEVIRAALFYLRETVRDYRQFYTAELSKEESEIKGLAWRIASALRHFKIFIPASTTEYGRNECSSILCFHNLWSSRGNATLLKQIVETEFIASRTLGHMLDEIEKSMKKDDELLNEEVKGLVIHE